MLNDQLGRKIYLMLQDAFDGYPPLCIQVGYDGGVVFLESEDRQISLPPDFLTQRGFWDKTATYSNPALRADVSTDDWPFFYMPERIYPFSYLVMVGLVLVLTLVLTSSFFRNGRSLEVFLFFCWEQASCWWKRRVLQNSGLTFGNSWQVIGLVIAGIMVMAYFANLVVQRLRITNAVVALRIAIGLSGDWLVGGEKRRTSFDLDWAHRDNSVVNVSSVFLRYCVFDPFEMRGRNIRRHVGESVWRHVRRIAGIQLHVLRVSFPVPNGCWIVCLGVYLGTLPVEI